jgi:protein TonB
MNDRRIFTSFAASSVIHLIFIPVAALLIQAEPIKPVLVPIELMAAPVAPEAKQPEIPPPRPKAQKITAPKLLSRPAMSETPASHAAGNMKDEVSELEPIEEPAPSLASLPPAAGSAQGGWNTGKSDGEAEGNSAGAGNLFGKGDVGVIGGSGVEGGGGGRGISGVGRGDKGDGAGGEGIGSGEALSGLARPLGGYQVKPRYPESARRAGVQGITVLRVRVMESGRVGEVLIEKSAGFPDLDYSAAEAVKKWLFEPARRGKEAVSVWVLLPVKFELR